MIKVVISNDNDNIDSITIKGHAGFAEYGKDIVCSAVSSIVVTTVNAIITFDENYISYTEEKDKFFIKVNSYNEIVKNLINNMINMLKEIESNYPKNIKIRKENL